MGSVILAGITMWLASHCQSTHTNMIIEHTPINSQIVSTTTFFGNADAA